MEIKGFFHFEIVYRRQILMSNLANLANLVHILLEMSLLAGQIDVISTLTLNPLTTGAAYIRVVIFY